MYISEYSMDLYLLENYPHKFVSLYSQTSLQEGMIGNLKNILANVTKNIGFSLIKSGIDTKSVIKEIRKEISSSQSVIINNLKTGDGELATYELNNMIRKIWFKMREFYKSRGVMGKSILILLFLFIIIMTLTLLMWTLMHYAIIPIVLIVFIPIAVIVMKFALDIIKFKHKSGLGFPEKELDKTIITAFEKIGVKRNIIIEFLSNMTKKTTDKLQKDLDSALEKKTSDPKSGFTTKAILMIIKTIRDQKKSGSF